MKISELIDVYSEMQFMPELSSRDHTVLSQANIEFKSDELTGTVMYMKKRFDTRDWEVLTLQMRSAGYTNTEMLIKCKEHKMRTSRGPVTATTITNHIGKFKKLFEDAGFRFPGTPTRKEINAFVMKGEKLTHSSRREMGAYSKMVPDEADMVLSRKHRVITDAAIKAEKRADKVSMRKDDKDKFGTTKGEQKLVDKIKK